MSIIIVIDHPKLRDIAIVHTHIYIKLGYLLSVSRNSPNNIVKRVKRMGSRLQLLPRWYSSLGDISLIVPVLLALIPEFDVPKGRGRLPKHSIKAYLCILVLKEMKKSSLRDAETDWSRMVCGEPIDHSVLHYWEQNIPRQFLEKCIRDIGEKLEELLGHQFSVTDATASAGGTKGL